VLAIISGMLLSFIVMLGIYGTPAVQGAPTNINVMTAYIFKPRSPHAHRRSAR
jgi:iron(III) transport system permease protein